MTLCSDLIDFIIRSRINKKEQSLPLSDFEKKLKFCNFQVLDTLSRVVENSDKEINENTLCYFLYFGRLQLSYYYVVITRMRISSFFGFFLDRLLVIFKLITLITKAMLKLIDLY